MNTEESIGSVGNVQCQKPGEKDSEDVFHLPSIQRHGNRLCKVTKPSAITLHMCRPSHLHPRNLALLRLTLFILIKRVDLHLPYPQSERLIQRLLVHDCAILNLLRTQVRHSFRITSGDSNRSLQQYTVLLSIYRPLDRLFNARSKSCEPVLVLQHHRVLR